MTDRARCAARVSTESGNSTIRARWSRWIFIIEDVRAQFPELKLENLLEELHAVDENGRVYRGARAINEILRRQNGLKGYLAYLWYIPGYAWLADRQYKRIAASRYARDASGRMKGQGQAADNRDSDVAGIQLEPSTFTYRRLAPPLP